VNGSVCLALVLVSSLVSQSVIQVSQTTNATALICQINGISFGTAAALAQYHSCQEVVLIVVLFIVAVAVVVCPEFTCLVWPLLAKRYCF